MQRKRDDFLTRNSSKEASMGRLCGSRASTSDANRSMPQDILRQSSQFQHAISSLSSSSDSSIGNGSGTEEERRSVQGGKTREKSGNGEQHGCQGTATEEKGQSNSFSDGKGTTSKKVSCSGSSNAPLLAQDRPSNDFHDYNAQSLPDPLPESGDDGSPSFNFPPNGDSDHCVVDPMCTDSSSDEEEEALSGSGSIVHSALKSGSAGAAVAKLPSVSGNLPPNIARSGGISHNIKVNLQEPAISTAAPSATTTPAGGTLNGTQAVSTTASSATATSLSNGKANLSRAPVTSLPPFVGIGERKHVPTDQSASKASDTRNTNCLPPVVLSSSNTQASSAKLPPLPSDPSVLPPSANHHRCKSDNNNHHGNREENKDKNGDSHRHRRGRKTIITIDNEYAATPFQSCSSHRIPPENSRRDIQAHYHINEDDMILTENILMCPFIFRSQEAICCGALTECVQPGMLRATFSSTNKLRNVEMIFDAMGFCQQLERASGNEGMAHIIPNCLEMALSDSSDGLARVITLGKGPEFQVVSVNEAWTKVTGYTQLDVEGKDLRKVLLKGGETQHQKEVKMESAGDKTTDMHDFEMVAQKGVCATSTNIHFDVNGREFVNFTISYPLSNLKDEITHILHVCQELPARE